MPKRAMLTEGGGLEKTWKIRLAENTKHSLFMCEE
jgi:hypothetical protein